MREASRREPIYAFAQVPALLVARKEIDPTVATLTPIGPPLAPRD